MEENNYFGLTKDEYIGLLKECGMCTKKWTYSKMKMFDQKRKELLQEKNKKKKFNIKNIFRRKKNGRK